MKSRTRSILLLSLLAVLAGCASTEVTQQTPTVKETITRPNQIWIYDFGAMPGDVPSDYSARHDAGGEITSLTDMQIVTDRRLGALIASDLVEDIQSFGVSAVQAMPGSSPQVGDSEIRGYLASIEDGGLARRFIIGFGDGRSEMKTVAECYLMTPHGLRKLGSWTLNSSGNKAPGIIVPVTTAIALSNPLHLLFAAGIKMYGEVSGRSKLEGRANATADALAGELRIAFQDWGWMSSTEGGMNYVERSASLARQILRGQAD
jgi:uncharacterized protein DUF4410